ncbi:MAG: YceI family protein [Anditalea sp.]
MKASYKKHMFLLLPVLAVCLQLQAQTNYILAPGAEFTVSGTSSLHDWTLTSHSASGEAIINLEESALKDILKLSVAIKAETLKSGKSGMDGNTYKALKTKKNPEISFSLKQIKSIEKKGDHYLVEAGGTLTIAGESRMVSLQAKAYPDMKKIQLSGSKTFNMTDFKVDPPTALLGTIKTGDEITVHYNFTFINKKS